MQALSNTRGRPRIGQKDDAPVGRNLTRREALVLLGGAGAAGLLMAMGCSPATGGVIGTSGSDDTSGSSTSCTAKPALTEGPYFVDERLNRSDIRSDPSDRLPIWRFFNGSSWAVMAVMMGGGMALRLSHLVPDWAIAFFYSGLGLALLLAGMRFVRVFARQRA